MKRLVRTNVLDFPVQGRREPSGARSASLKATQVPGALFWGEAPGTSLHARPASVRRGLAARYGSYFGLDGYGGAFAEAPGHRIGKAMAAEPSPTTVVGVIFYMLPWMGRRHLLCCKSPVLAHRDRQHLDRLSSLSGHSGHEPIFSAQRSVANAESAQGISPRAAHRSGRDTLVSSGSCHRAKAAAFR